MKKLIAVMLAVLLVMTMTACGADDGKYVIGICQIQKHAALDAATQGFKDALTEALGAENLTFQEKDAGGDFINCGTIMDGFVAENVDMILANATPPLQAAASATATIPVLGTSVTDYATALNIANWTGTVGGNISGTSDLAPLDQQAAMVKELFPEAKNVGLLYCSAEPNSVYQVEVVQGHLEELGFACEQFGFADVNELSAVTQRACDYADVIYIPTDNTCATYTETIANVVIPANVPVVCGESNTCAGCGVATLSIDYYDLGYTTGKMAVRILRDGEDITKMKIEYAPEVKYLYNEEICNALGIKPLEGYEKLAVEE